MFELAQINIARLLASLSGPRIAEFVAELASINELADRSEGFIWRLKSESGEASYVPYSDDPLVLVNMSVWTGPEALKNFSYRSRHVEVFRRRAEWFEPQKPAPYCLWWVPAGHRPTVAEGRERLEHYRAHGPSQHAFWFQQLFPAPDPVLA